MKFINKNLRQVDGNNLVSVFLSNNWNNTFNIYNPINYRSVAFRQQLKQSLRQLLLDEQDHLCCYCMCQLTNDDTTTLEHIVPQSTTSQQILNQYTHHLIIRDNVCLQSVFEMSNIRLATPPFPLEIAYENLTVSCKGDFPRGSTYHTCNHKRKNEFIEPLFYISTIEKEISYRKAGLMFSLNSDYDESISTLNLNYDTLERIREVWYYISVVNITDIENAVTESERNSILTLNLINISDTRRRTLLINNFKTEPYWKILLQYKWFHNYYLTHYPANTR